MLLLDTHVLIWWLTEGSELEKRWRQPIETAERTQSLYVSAITLWEIAKLVERGKIKLRDGVDVLLTSLETNRAIQVLPITAAVALKSTRLGANFHNDPADQLITATAIVHKLQLVTANRRIRMSDVVSVV